MSAKSGSNELSPDERALAGVNLLLKSDYKSLKELRNGAVWCHLLDRILPGSVRLELVSEYSTNLTDWHANYHLLHTSLRQLHIPMILRVHEIIDGDAEQTMHLVYSFLELYVRKETLGSQLSLPKKSDKLLPRIGSSCFVLIPKLKNILAIFHDEKVKQHQIEQAENNDEKEVTIAKIVEKQPKKRPWLLDRAGFWSATSRRSCFLPKRLFTKIGKRMAAGHQEEEEPLQLQVQHLLGQQHSQIMPSETQTSRSEPDGQQVLETQPQQKQQIVLKKKPQIDKSLERQLIQECSELERAELFMERLWLQCRERRKHAHNNKNNTKWQL
ncbi:uncharacterized protein LOC6644834 isoform X1 [Drosophila willistoni]|uniref:uncharacterized protein LOC6644834 isoform X1 n=1 Tax=Drosophila willistoni TaxID=7260 RepID=UPI000C26D4F4|nr:uncharacterized protein LOC6644834 isoform X1 [Drosophila willistoni]